MRFRGISSHDPDVLREAIPSGLCDVVMFAVGPFVDPRYVEPKFCRWRRSTVWGRSASRRSGPASCWAIRRGTTARSIPPAGENQFRRCGRRRRALPRLSVRDCLHYTLTLDPDVALLGMSFPNEQDAAFAAAAEFHQPLPPERMADVRRRAAEAIAEKGPCWWNPDPAGA